MVYLVVRMLMLSKLPAEMPWMLKTAKNKVKIKPTLHLNKLAKNELNLSSFTLFEIFEIIEKTKLNMKIGTIK